MSMTEKRATGHKPAAYKRDTVESASRHTTPHSKNPASAHKSLSHPKDAREVGAKGVKEGMSHSRFGHREGFTPNTGTVSDPMDCPSEGICDMEPGSLQGD